MRSDRFVYVVHRFLLGLGGMVEWFDWYWEGFLALGFRCRRSRSLSLGFGAGGTCSGHPSLGDELSPLEVDETVQCQR